MPIRSGKMVLSKISVKRTCIGVLDDINRIRSRIKTRHVIIFISDDNGKISRWTPTTWICHIDCEIISGYSFSVQTFFRRQNSGAFINFKRIVDIPSSYTEGKWTLRVFVRSVETYNFRSYGNGLADVDDRGARFEFRRVVVSVFNCDVHLCSVRPLRRSTVGSCKETGNTDIEALGINSN